jgi:hypothetical protein
MATDFNARLAELADEVRRLDGGAELSRALIALATDVDAYLEQRTNRQYEQSSVLFQKWNDFMNEAVREARAYGNERLATERRRLAQRVAGDERWIGGYRDVLALLENE